MSSPDAPAPREEGAEPLVPGQRNLLPAYRPVADPRDDTNAEATADVEKLRRVSDVVIVAATAESVDSDHLEPVDRAPAILSDKAALPPPIV